VQTVAIYLPMVPEAAVAFLACARLGAVHSVVFAGFSAESLRDRIVDCKASVVITTDEGKRGGKTIATKSIVDSAVEQSGDVVKNVLVVKRTGSKVNWKEGRDLWWNEEILTVQSYCSPTYVSSEDPLFILYTSVRRPYIAISSELTSCTGIDRQAKGCRPHHSRLPPGRCLDCQIRL
jgi:acetyl-CoA synthetase